jgi:hypothetical protein
MELKEEIACIRFDFQGLQGGQVLLVRGTILVHESSRLVVADNYKRSVRIHTASFKRERGRSPGPGGDRIGLVYQAGHVNASHSSSPSGPDQAIGTLDNLSL